MPQHRPLAAVAVALAVAGVTAMGAHASADPAAPRTTSRVALNSCWSNDNGLPVITELSASSGTVEEGQQITLTAQVQDVGGPGPATGTAGAIELNLNKPDGGIGFQPELERQADGSYSGTITVPRDPAALGTFSVVDARVSDKAGNVRRYLGARQLAKAGLGASFEVVPSTTESESDPPVVSDVSVPTSVDARPGGRKVTVTARVTDPGSGVAEVAYDLYLLPDPELSRGTSVTMHLVPGTTDLYRGSHQLSRWGRTSHQTYYVEQLRVRDRAGNTGFGSAGDFVQVRQKKDPKPRALGPPRIKGGQKTFDVRRHGRTFTLLQRFADTGSGVRQVQFVAQYPSARDPFNPVALATPLGRSATLVRGNRHRGTWSETFRISRCLARSGTLHVFESGVADAANGLIVGGELRRRIVARDHVRPAINGVRVTARSISIHFSEKVRGVVGASAVVRDKSDTPIPGTWRCETQSGKKVPCRRGPLVRAIFTPDTPGGGTSIARIGFNPDRHINVVDLHRNPFPGHLVRGVRY